MPLCMQTLLAIPPLSAHMTHSHFIVSTSKEAISQYLPTLESLARDLPAFLLSRPLSLTPHSPTSLTFNQRDYEQKWSLKLNCHSNIAPRHQSFKTSIFPSDVVLGHHLCIYRTAWSQKRQRERQWQRTYRRRPKALETQEKNDRDRITLITSNSLRVHSSQVVDSRQNLDANQSN